MESPVSSADRAETIQRLRVADKMSILRSKRVLVDSEIRPADVVIDQQYIIDIASYGSGESAVDVGERLITPGFVDLHSDAVEKEIEPRPGTHFPVDGAIVELDKKLSTCGITTMFHAISFYEESVVGTRGTEMGAHIARRIQALNNVRLLIDNRIHIRYEITSFGSLGAIEDLLQKGAAHLLSFMDHTPGQGQYPSLDRWMKDHEAVFGLENDRAREVIDIMAEKKASSSANIHRLARQVLHHGIPLLSHDDDCCEKIDWMKKLGVTVSEFPTNEAAAIYAKKQKLATGMGAPNVVRGGSQNNNLSARRLIERGACDFLCSDYHPTSMLQAVYTASRATHMSLAETFELVTANPAKIAGLEDRGRIGAGYRADLVVIDETFLPSVMLTIKSGVPVYNGLGTLGLPTGTEQSSEPQFQKAVI